MKKLFYSELQKVLNKGKDAYVITIVKSSNEELLGSKILKSSDEIIYDKEEYLEFYTEVLKKINLNNSNKLITIDDETEVFIEHVANKPSLIICGGGHIALPLCNIAKMLDFNITVIDDRKEFANSKRFELADSIICDSFTQALNKVSFSNNSYFVIVTRGHRADKECLEIILKNSFKYVGMIGSRAKVATVVKGLLEDGYTKDDIAKVHTPIGLNIGAQTPAEIAVSIVGEIIQVKSESNICSIDNEILDTINKDNKKKALVTILDKRGSSPRGQGAKMLVLEDERLIGTIGGGIVENEAYKRALEVIKNEKSEIEFYDLSNSVAAKLGMACGGQIKVLVEYIERGE